MNKLITLIMTILMVILINFNYKSYCIDYYDLYFQKENENIIVSEYEDINYNKKHYKTIVNTTISKDEEFNFSYYSLCDFRTDTLCRCDCLYVTRGNR